MNRLSLSTAEGPPELNEMDTGKDFLNPMRGWTDNRRAKGTPHDGRNVEKLKLIKYICKCRNPCFHGESDRSASTIRL